MKKGMELQGIVELILVLVVLLLGLYFLILYPKLQEGVDATIEENQPDMNLPVIGGGPSKEIFLNDAIDWNQVPTQRHNPSDAIALQNQELILRIAQEEKFPPLLALTLSYTESMPKFHHRTTPTCDVRSPGCVIDSGSGSKGLFQVTHKTAYGDRGAPEEYRGKGSLCQADYHHLGGICQGLDFCQEEGNVRCGIRIFKNELQKDKPSYIDLVNRNCAPHPATQQQYLKYADNPVQRAIRRYNAVCCDNTNDCTKLPPGQLGDDTHYVETFYTNAQRFI